ncbi:hypothetical protein A8U91_01869 [Halomonas elongata]|uniref:Uncharacterized protein n=1 Tax=Halomonas elongata TaxID=2746 RepID=A0A1B8P5K0_HALEL|nr:hypothetical protein A8U91_01869 [Halomonas elongata]
MNRPATALQRERSMLIVRPLAVRRVALTIEKEEI